MNTQLNKLLRKLDILACVKRKRKNEEFSFFIKEKWELNKVKYILRLMADISNQNLIML